MLLASASDSLRVFGAAASGISEPQTRGVQRAQARSPSILTPVGKIPEWALIQDLEFL